jgi:hypothetical protein
MTMTRSLWIAATAVAAIVGLTGCERLPVDTVQVGYRGTGMEQVTNPRIAIRPSRGQWAQGQAGLSKREGTGRFKRGRVQPPHGGDDPMGGA